MKTDFVMGADITDRLGALHDAGVSIWLDTLSRELLDTGEFARLVDHCHVSGATSNPTIFAKAITGSDRYSAQCSGSSLPVSVKTASCSSVSPSKTSAAPPTSCSLVYERTNGRDGFVSFECTPDLADDTDATVDQARDLWARLARPNTMIKVPATAAGVPAIEQLTADGVNVNVTLLFSVDRYQEVMEALPRRSRSRRDEGEPVDRIASAASFFVSRVDTKVDSSFPSPRHARKGRGGQRPGRIRPVPADARAGTLASPRCGRCTAATAALGQHGDEESTPTPTCSTSSL